jgi:hypothetical protein
MRDIIINALVVLLAQGVFYFFITRREGARDSLIVALRDRVDELEKDEIKKLQEGIEHAAHRRGTIYDRLENKLVSRRECKQAQATIATNVARIERQVSGLSARIGELTEQTAGTGQQIRDVSEQVSHLTARIDNYANGGSHAHTPC